MQETVSDEGRFRTSRASSYLQQLCKHFGHKREVRFDATRGEVSLPPGPVVLAATEDELVVTVNAQDAAGLVTARSIVDSHLERFAFRENFKTMDWAGAGTEDGASA
ncbi:DUF2218 domain-containing protein [Pseudoroseicyclus sp. CXY001]|uniref:DUF2218 domain-containing protein n=1 Tax=Pseudoroseicyclus sp. CXY001 TaxID=3242492 RepID=UPI0035717332